MSVEREELTRVGIIIVVVFTIFSFNYLFYQYGEQQGLNYCKDILEQKAKTISVENYRGYESNETNDTRNIILYLKSSLRNSNIEALRIEDNLKATMIIYPNGTFWIKNGTEQYNGEQLGRVALAFGSYTKGFCEGIRWQ